jgi:hypothetical protein
MFKTGINYITQGVQQLINDQKLTLHDVFKIVERHGNCDWGELSEQDQNQNRKAIKEGNRVMSSYTVNEVKLWVITEDNGGITTVLLPEEY